MVTFHCAMQEELREAVKVAVAAGFADNVSAYIREAVRAKLREDGISVNLAHQQIRER